MWEGAVIRLLFKLQNTFFCDTMRLLIFEGEA